ncbi:hypothetical protein Hypma_002817 [Hypsizygus marmoreus]|uniref:Uncharacterized protein n=1 Tax=Hypsizygus marmoreus TaxID=39966 RepID=A0A369J9P9_HYPMA|nr:hypothetical protein Hypma_002817 [Hypsizygus marmoreus]
MRSTNTTNTGAVPMKSAIFAALAMAWAWGVIGGSVGLNALIKANQTQSRLKSRVPPPAVVTITVDDVFHSGVVLTTVAALIAVLCTIFTLLLVLPSTKGLAKRSLRIQSFILAFCATWLFACAVAYTVIFATRNAKVSASIGGIELPPALVEQAEQVLGSTRIYRHIDYLRLVAILPWFTVLFTFIAAGVLFVAGSRARHNVGAPEASAGQDTHSDAGIVEKEAVTKVDESKAP